MQMQPSGLLSRKEPAEAGNDSGLKIALADDSAAIFFLRI
jgi:hypothetical protein